MIAAQNNRARLLQRTASLKYLGRMRAIANQIT
jgi:hypothetical protein